MLTGSRGFYSSVIPPLLMLLLYLATSLPLIDGLLVLPSVRKLAFVCLSVRELKEYPLTDAYEGTSCVCTCEYVCLCLWQFVSIHLLLQLELKQCEFYMVTMVTGAIRRAE